jgi:ABC-type multidrug transport system ATPase subunit
VVLQVLPGAIKNASYSMGEAHSSSDIVVADGLVKQFGRFAALRGVTAQFAPGKLYVIMGDNGAGKTTFLRTIAGLAQQTRGIISVLGSREIKSVRAQVGYMAHPSLLYDEMSGMENLNYFAGLYGLPDARCREVIAAIKLDPDLDRPVGQYSQGMRQRMSLARAILNDPKLLLLDEPFSNVDHNSAKEMTSLLANMRDQGKTIFVVTHQSGLLESIADEFVWLQAGKIVRRTPHLQVTK